MMTPQEVANCTFAKAAIGGYHMTSVDEFLDKLTEDYSALYKENAQLKAKLKVLVDKIAEYQEMEEAMRSTLLTAQKMASSMVAEAEQKRNAMIASASADAQNRRNELAQEVELEERRLMEIRQRVDRELTSERKRLAYGKEALRKFISDVAAVCNEELALLQRLPDLPMDEEQTAVKPTVQPPQQIPPPAQSVPSQPPAPVTIPAAQPEPEPARMPQPPEPQAQTRLPAQTSAPPAVVQGDPFEDDEPVPSAADLEATRVLNLDELQFGRNYNKKKKGNKGNTNG